MDDVAWRYFLRGQCHALALALSMDLDLPIVGDYKPNRDRPHHILNRAADGTLIDANWVVAWGGAASTWGTDQRPITSAEIGAFVRAGYAPVPDLELARSFVAKIARAANKRGVLLARREREA